MGDSKFERFGKYLILDHLVDGGMAKICRARFLGEQANKIVAIKMVQAQFSKDPSFVQMFEDELKVTFGLLHPNIAQMYDYGMVDNQLYTAMEYVDGANLKQYLDRLKQKNFVFPVEISTYITSQVCQALHYAHTFTDKLTGKPFNIIHRDISPHNIMLTYDGAVKVIDFGIAKADSNSEATQAGTIKGKLSYLAPEYLDGLELDHRYDQFAVGITLWELLCSRKLFQATNDLAVLKLIQNCKVPAPSSINPNVPKELDQIVLKSLAKDRNQRYENMDKFNRALVKFLYSNYPDFNATDLGYFAKQLFKEEIVKDKEKFFEYGKIDIKPYINALANDGKVGGRPVEEVGERTGKTKKIEIDFGLEKQSGEDITRGLELDSGTKTGIRGVKNASVARKSAPPPPPGAKGQARRASGNRGQGTSRAKIGNAPVASVAGGQTRSKQVRRRAAGTGSGSASRKAAPQKSGGSGTGVFALVGCLALAFFVYSQSETIGSMVGIDLSGMLGKKAPERNVASGVEQRGADRSHQSQASEPEYGHISFGNLEPKMKVFINGRRVDVMGIKAKVPLDQNLKVSVVRSGFKKHTFPEIYRLSADGPNLDLSIPKLEKETVGILSTSQNFTSGSKLILEVNGEKVERDLPFNNMRVPAGQYEAVISNPLLGTERKVIFEIKENKRLFLE